MSPIASLHLMVSSHWLQTTGCTRLLCGKYSQPVIIYFFVYQGKQRFDSIGDRTALLILKGVRRKQESQLLSRAQLSTAQSRGPLPERKGPLTELSQATSVPMHRMISEFSQFLLQRSLASSWCWHEAGASTLSTQKKFVCSWTFPVALQLINL